jgi:hypothetical protein
MTGPPISRARLLLTSVAEARYGSRVARDRVELLILSKKGDIFLAGESPLKRERADPEIAWGTSDLYLDGGPLRPFFGLLRRSASLKWFQSAAAGFDGPIFADLAERGVRVCNSHANSIPIAEFVMRAVLDRRQRADLWRGHQQGVRWEGHDFGEIHGSTWLVIGMGGIGSAVAIRARAFGARVIGCRRRPTGDEPADVIVTEAGDEVIGCADVVVLAAPANQSTEGLVDAPFPGGYEAGVDPGQRLEGESRRRRSTTGSPEPGCARPGHPGRLQYRTAPGGPSLLDASLGRGNAA